MIMRYLRQILDYLTCRKCNSPRYQGTGHNISGGCQGEKLFKGNEKIHSNGDESLKFQSKERKRKRKE